MPKVAGQMVSEKDQPLDSMQLESKHMTTGMASVTCSTCTGLDDSPHGLA